MATVNPIPCGPCRFKGIRKDAERWCTRCEKGFCEDCKNVHFKSKESSNHQLISIKDYYKTEKISISLFCKHHGKKLELFCKSHDTALCMVCIPSNHKTCSDVIPISQASLNAGESIALSDLDEDIKGALHNVKQCIDNRKSATEKIEKQELAIKTMIFEARRNINSHLDKLQEKLFHKLRLKSSEFISKHMKLIHKLESTALILNKLRKQTLHMKQFSSDLEVFLGTRQVNQSIRGEIETIKSDIVTSKNYELKVAIHTLIEKLSNKVTEFGKIKTSECAAELAFNEPKIDQAQIRISVPKLGNISNKRIQLVKTFQMKGKNKMDITGCVILPNGHLLMANSTNDNHLIEYSGIGEHIRDIVVSSKPFDIAVLNRNRICLSYSDAHFLDILNNNTFIVERRIRLKSVCHGVSYNDGRLYVRNGYSTIQVMDLSGKEFVTLKIPSNSVLNITTFKKRIYYTDYRTNIVHCCRLDGIELWQVKSESLSHYFGVTVDKNHNVYVVGYRSNNLTIIQHDGKDSKTLLTKSEGLDRPQAVYFDKDKKLLLICNEEGKVALYKIV